MERTTTVVYTGKEYPLKSFNGLTFSTIELYKALEDSERDEETTNLDDSVAFFFDEEVFNNNRPMELYQIYNEFE